MTGESFSKLKDILTSYEIEEDPLDITALDIYNKVLGMIKPVCNVGHVSDDVLHSILIRFDYKNQTFQQDVDSFCLDIKCILNSILLDDKLILVVVSILVYCKCTDIKLNEVNNLINSICSIEYKSSKDDVPDVCLMANLFKNNIIGSQTLSIDSASQMMKAVSSASDLLGSSCVNSPSNEICCANNCLKTPEELGVQTDLILRLNQLVMNGDSVNPKDLIDAIRTLSIDASVIELDRKKPTIYDIINIRFCWSFNWIYNWILYTPSEGTAKQMMNTVISCLLETDKSYLNEDNDFLVLEEMVLNTLDYLVNGKGYYTHIRAKNLNYKGGCRLSPENLNSQSERLLDLQRKILEALNKYGYFAPSGITEGISLDTLLNTDVNQGNCRDGNGSTENLYESMSALQTIELDGEFLEPDRDIGVCHDVKKLLGESFKLSTALDRETEKMKSQFNESVQWMT